MNKQKTQAESLLTKSRELSDRNYKLKKIEQARRELKAKLGETKKKYLLHAKSRKSQDLPDRLGFKFLYIFLDRIQEILLASIIGFVLLILFLL
jgi:hypothetical protein